MGTPTDLRDRVAAVTGAASGIGRAIAVALKSAGAHVFAADHDWPSATEEEFDALGIARLFCDVRVVEDIRNLIEEAAAHGRLDILVNNAGIGMVKAVEEVTEEDWDRCLDTNLKAAFFACRFAVPWMRPQGGSIINIASNAGLLPRAHDPVYSISKGALVALTKSLALSLSPARIRVNAICPGPVSGTRMMERDLEQAPDRAAAERQFIAASPLARQFGRMIHPQEVAAAALYLAADHSVFVTGTCIAIDGGKSLGVPPTP